MRIIHGVAAAVAVLLLSGCTDGHGGRTMHGDLADLDQHVGEIRAETEAHASAIAAADTIDAVLNEEARHHQALEGHGDSMNGVIGHMGGCHDGQGDPPDTSAMHDAMEDMLAECTEHMALVDSAGNLTGIPSEETRHQGAMESMIDLMEAMTDSMMDDAGEYDCGGMM